MVQFLTMGLFRKTDATTNDSSIKAQYAPQILGDQFMPYNNYYSVSVMSRLDAISVPAIKKCRDLIAGTIAGIPLEYYKKSTGEHIAAPRWVEQPSLNQPRFVTILWTVDSLLMYGTAFWQIKETYQEDGRMARAEWIPNTRVTFDTDFPSTIVTQYYIDGVAVPMSGIGSLITFQKDEGILNTSARTIQSAIDIHRAAAVAAQTPIPSGYIRNNGADLDPKEVSGLLAAWSAARKNRATAYLKSTLEYSATSFSPKDMMYNEAIQNLATEIARMCGVPPYYLSADQNTTMTYANVQDERRQFIWMIQPYICAIEDRLSMDDISTSGHYVKFAVDDTFLRTDPMERLLVLEKMLGLGLITTEQAMEMEDLSPNGNEMEN
jgi:HK97 family phage portal protein